MATGNVTRVDLSWSGFADTGGSGISRYRLVFGIPASPSARCTDGTEIYGSTGTTHVHTGVSTRTTYGYRVCAVDGAGNVSVGATASACLPACGGVKCGDSNGCGGTCAVGSGCYAWCSCSTNTGRQDNIYGRSGWTHCGWQNNGANNCGQAYVDSQGWCDGNGCGLVVCSAAIGGTETRHVDAVPTNCPW